MLNSGEGCKNSLVGIHGQTEWVVGQGLAIYGPVYELVTCVRSCGESCCCAFVVSTSTFYTTHCWVVYGSCHCICTLWKSKAVLDCSRSRYHLVGCMRHSIDCNAMTCCSASCIRNDIEVACIVPSKIHE